MKVASKQKADLIVMGEPMVRGLRFRDSDGEEPTERITRVAPLS